MKKRLLAVLKIAVPVAILAWLVFDVLKHDPDTFQLLADQRKNWLLLVAGTCVELIALSVTYLRWYLLVEALRLPFRIADAFRLGFLAFLLNFVSVGAVGGDLFKAVFIAREQKQRRTEAVASVVVDRVIGMFGMVLVCSFFLLFLGEKLPEDLRVVSWAIHILTVAFIVGLALLMAPGVTMGRVGNWLFGLPKIGPVCERIAAALAIYSRQRTVLLITISMSVCSHILFGTGIFLIAHGLYSEVPSFLDHIVIVALSNAFASLPLAPNGVGTYELAMNYLYAALPAGGVGEGKGLVVALCYRVITILVAAIGVVYYWASRRDVQQLMQEAEELSEHEDEDLARAAGLPWQESE